MTAPILTFPSPTTQGIEAVAPEPPEEGIYPHSWDFAYGSAGWGNAIRLYSALTPWLGAETATGFQMNSMRAELHDGWNGNFGTGQSQQFPPVLTSAFAPPSVAAGWPTPRNYGDRMRVQNGAFCTPSIGGWCGQDNKIAVYRGNDTESSYDFNSGTGSFAVGETATASISGATVTFSTAVSGATGSALVRVESGPLVLGDVISGGGNSHTINSSLNLTPFAHLDWQAELWAFLVPSNGNQVLDWNASQWLQFNGVHGAGGFWSTISAPNQLPHTPGVGPRVATGYNNGVLGPDTNFDIYQWVQALEEVGDVEVAQDFVMSRLDGQVAPEARVFPFAGLGARIRGGNWNSPASAFGGLSLCDGYFVYLQNDWNADPLDWQWVLIRCNGGTVTQLDERPDLLGVNRAAETQATSINDLGLLSGTRKVRLRVTGTSPVRIEAWTTPRLTTIGQAFPGGGGFDPQIPVWVSGKVFDFNDSSGSRISSAGRCSFALGRARDNSSGERFRVHSSKFSIKNMTTSVVVFQDEWKRVNTFAQRYASADAALPSPARSLQSLISGDVYGVDTPLPGFAGRLDRDTVDGSQIEAKSLAGTEPGWHIWQFRPASVATQRRRVTFTFDTSPPSGWLGIAGVFLRGSFTPSAMPGSLERLDQGGKTLYVAFMLYAEATGVWNLQLYSYHQGSGSAVVIASVTPAGLALGTPFTLDLQARNFGGANQFLGSPQLVVRLDGAEQTLVLDPSVPTGPNAFEVTGNTIIDNRDNPPQSRILVGTHVGFWMRSVDHSIFVDDWEEDTYLPASGGGTGDDPPPPEGDQATIPIASEADNISGATLASLPLEWPVTVSRAHRLNSWAFDSGHVQTQTVSGSVERRVWRVQVTTSPRSDLTGLAAFFDARNGMEEGFTWTTPYPDAETVTVHFKTPDLSHRIRGILSNTSGFGTNTRFGGFTFEMEELLP